MRIKYIIYLCYSICCSQQWHTVTPPIATLLTVLVEHKHENEIYIYVTLYAVVNGRIHSLLTVLEENKHENEIYIFMLLHMP